MFVNIKSISWLAFLALPYIGSHRPNETDIPVFRVQPFANSDVVLNSSWISARENLNTAYIKSLDVERLLHNFRINSGLPSGAKALEGWESPGVGLRGHFVGHYLSAT
ncbi:MAG: beta-L-arabinofuranosidase domain-containing protein, partial [Flavitalea sp.]